MITGLSVGDVDSPNLTTTLSLPPGSGILTVTAGSGATITGDGTGTVTIAGTQAQINAALAAVIYTPTADFNTGAGSIDLTVATTDGTLTDTDTVAITVTPVPDIVDDSVTTPEDTAIIFNAITGTNGASADNFENPGRAVTAVTQGAHGTVSFAADGTLTYTPDANYNGPDSFTYTVTSGGVTETATVTVNVTPVNDLPVNTVPGPQSTPEDTGLTISGLSVGDVDSPNLTTTLSLPPGSGILTVTAGSGATITGDGTGTVTIAGTQAQINAALAAVIYTPTADFNTGAGSIDLTVATTDGTLTDTDTVAITVTPVPDIVDDSVTTPEDTAITFNAITGTNGASADNFENSGRAVTAVTQGAHGTVSFAADGTLTYTPAANYNGPDSFTYTVTSGGVTETATVTVNVTPVNDLPVNTVPGPQSTPEDTGLTISGLSVGDVDSPNLTTTLSLPPGSGILTVTAGSGATITGDGTGTVTIAGTQAQINAALAAVIYTPTADFNTGAGSIDLTVASTDGSLTDTDTVAITVTPVPDIVDDSVTTPEDTAIIFNAITGTNGASADNFENPGRAVTAVTQGAHGTVSFAADGTLTYTPAANYNGPDSFTYTVTSGGVTETATVTVNVTPVNDLPVNTVPGPQSTPEDTGLTISGLSVGDVDSPNLTTTLSLPPGSGILTVTAGSGATITGDGTGTVTIAGTQAQINAALAAVIYTPTADFNTGAGSIDLTVASTDGTLTDTDTVAITVTPVPDIVDDSVTTPEDTAIIFNAITGTNGASADNFENPGRAVTAVTQGAHGTVSFAADGTLTYTPAANYNGPDSFTYTVTSGGVTETATVTVNVTPVNDLPVNTVPGPQSTPEDTGLTISGLSVGDVDSPNLTTTLSLPPGSGILTVTAGSGATITGDGTGTVTIAGTQAQINAALAAVIYTPTADFNTGAGSIDLTVASTDGTLTDTDTVAITVTPVPDIVDDSVTTPEDTAIIFNAITGTNGASADNFENPGRAVTAVTQGAHGTVSFAADGTLTYTPAANYNGPDSFTYTVTSGGVTETATVTVNVTPVNDLPVNTVPGPQSTPEDTGLTISGLSVGDVDSPNLTTTLSLPPGSGILTVTAGSGATITGDGTGTVTIAGTQAQINAALAAVIYTPTADFNTGAGSIDLTVASTDGSLTDTDTVAITVTPVPDIVDDSVTTPEDTAITFNAITGTNGASADNFENSGRAVTAVTQGAHGTVSFAADGTLTYTPAANYNGPDSFTYTVTSGGVTETATVTVNVTPVNDLPVNTVPGPQSTPEDTGLTISGLSVGDVDSPNLTTTLSLPPGSGILTVTAGSGATITGDGTGTVTIAGTQAQINAALAAVIYTPTADFNTGAGSIDLTVASTDGSLTDTDTVAITVTPVPDIVDDSVTTPEDTAITFNAITGTNGASADNFENSGRAVTAVTQGAHGTVSFAADGTLTYTPAANYNGPDSFTYTVTSGGVTETATVTVNVTPVNDLPVNTVPGPQSTPEDTGLTISGLSVGDVDSPNLTTTLSLPPGSGILTVTAGSGATITGDGTGTVTIAGTQAQINAALAAVIYTPTADFNTGAGSIDLTVASTDGSLTDTDTVAITVTPVPDIVDDSVTTPEDTAITFNAITGTNGASADNFENSGRAVTAVTQGAHGTVSFAADGTLTYTPAANYNGPDSFTYTVTSGGVTETATVTVNVTPVNDLPVNTVPGPQSTPEDTGLTISGLSVGDVDSPNLTTTLSLPPGSGILTVTAGSGATITGDGTGTVTIAGTQAQINAALAAVIYTPTADFNTGAGSIDLTVATTDGTLTDTDTVALTVTPVPDIVDDSVTTPEDTAIIFNAITGTNGASADNFENPGRAVTAVTQGAHGTVSFAADGTLTYTPAANYNGPDSFTYTVTSGGVTETATVTVNVTPVNDLPVNTVPGPQSTPEDTGLTISGLSVGDVDSPNLTTTLSLPPGSGILTVTAGSGATITGDGTGTVTIAGTQAQINAALAAVIYTPTADFNTGAGSIDLTVATTDGSLTDTDTVAITVTPVPDIVDDSVTTPEDTAIIFNAITGTNGASADNFENPGRAVTAVTQGAHGTVSFAADGTLTYTPAANYNGPDSFTYTVTSGGVTETATVTVNVTPVNDLPVNTVPGPQSTPEDTGLTISGLSVGDVDSPNLTTTLSLPPGSGILTVTAGSGATITGDGTGTVTIAGTQAQINAALAAVIYTPTADFNTGAGSIDLTVATTDGSLTDTDTVAITVTPVPDIVDDSVTTPEDTAITFNAITGTNGASADNFENSGRAVTAVTQGAHGTVSFAADGTLTYTPAANYNGPDSFTYTVTSGGVTETATVTVNVTPVNDLPVNTVPGPQSTPEDTGLTISGLSVGDVDSPNLTTTLSLPPGSGILTVTAGSGATITGDGTGTVTIAGTQAQINAALAAVIYTPTADFNTGAGSIDLTVATTDGTLTDTDTVAVTVTPVPDIVDDSVTTPEDTAITFNAITGTNGASADNFENPGRAVTAVTQGAHGTVSFAADGTLTYTPAANYNGPDSFTYTVTSGGVTETATVTVSVAPVNDPPVAVDDGPVPVTEDTPATGSVLPNDSDVDGDLLTVTQFTVAGDPTVYTAGQTATIAGVGTLVINADGSYTFTPVANYNGPVPTATYTISDGNGGS